MPLGWSSFNREPLSESVNSQSTDGKGRVPQLETVWLVSERQLGTTRSSMGSLWTSSWSGWVMSSA